MDLHVTIFLILILILHRTSGNKANQSSTIQLKADLKEPRDGDIDAETPLEAALPGPPWNVSVSVQLAHPLEAPASSYDEGVDQLNHKRLKLVIRWDHHPGSVSPEGYNVEVRAHSTSSRQLACTEHFSDFFRHVEYTEPTTVEIGSGTDKNDYLINYGCSYSVAVQSTPAALNPSNRVTLNVTVPECVENMCRCGRSRLPRPENVTVHGIRTTDGVERSYQVTWSYPWNADTINATFLVVRVEKPENMGFGSVYRKMQEYRHPRDKLLYEQMIHGIDPNPSYRVRLFAQDAHHCEGNTADVYLGRSDLIDSRVSGDTSKETVISTVSLCLVLVLLTSLVGVFTWRKWKRRLLLARSAQASRSARSSQIRRDGGRGVVHTSGSSCQNVINVLYVEKEIEEARQSGRADEYEISPTRLKLGIQIGKGAYGRVYLATAEGLRGYPDPTLVAVKQIKKKVGPDEADDFLAEIAMMKHVGKHENIVAMLGCVTLHQPYCMILEYVPHGDLLAYLRSLRCVYQQLKVNSSATSAEAPKNSSSAALLPKKYYSSSSHSTSDGHSSQMMRAATSSSTCSSQSSASYIVPEHQSRTLLLKGGAIDTSELQNFAQQIARGMEHLEMKGITHRDLAARNLLVSEGRVLKISDFGLSRPGIYVNTRTRMLPLRWLAIESMTDNLYCSKSDVWAYGVVLWEICTLGGFPYADVSDTHLLTHLLAGHRLVRPENASEKLYQMMLNCWHASPEERPTFRQLRYWLMDIESQDGSYVQMLDFDPCHTASLLPPTEEQVKSTSEENDRSLDA